MNYLKNQKLSVSEIAYLLGYTEAGSFIRAFKEWTGQSPKAYRLGVDGAGDTLLQDCQKE
jgi:AraC-like DNA-binding protein